MKDKYKKKDELVRELATLRESLTLLTVEISDHRHVLEQMSWTNVVLPAVTNVKRVASHVADQDSLLQGACAGIVQPLGFRRAWIALLDSSETPSSLREAGFGEVFAAFAEQVGAGRLCGTCRRALGESRVLVTEDPPNSCKECLLSGSYAGQGAMTRRIEYLGKVYGLLTVTAPMPLVHDGEVLELLAETADDLGRALHVLALRTQTECELENLRQ